MPLGRMNLRLFMQRLRMEVTSPFLLTLCVGLLSLLHSPKWTAIATGVIESIWNTSLLKLAFGASVLLFSLTALVQLAGFQSAPWRWGVHALRWIFDSAASVACTAASVLIGVVTALLVFVIVSEPHAWLMMGLGVWVLYLASLIVAMGWGGSYFLHHAEDWTLDRARALKLSGLCVCFLGLSLWYLLEGEKFPELTAFHQATADCRSAAAAIP